MLRLPPFCSEIPFLVLSSPQTKTISVKKDQHTVDENFSGGI